jgi:hypothetical protein
MMSWLGSKASYSLPRMSDDNGFVESLFRTVEVVILNPEYDAIVGAAAA